MIDIKEIKSIRLNKDGTFDVLSKKSSNNYTYFTVNWRKIPRYNQKGQLIDPDIFKEDIITKNGLEYWNQNFECKFLGSSSTLIKSDILASLSAEDAQETRDGKLEVYEYPKKGHSYIMAVDPAKDGQDAFAIQVVDITTIHFSQVASAKLQVDYLLMPEYLVEYAKWYNQAFLIIENNEGAGQSIADIIRRDYDYDNMYFDKQRALGTKAIKQKPYPGFRTTPKTRKLILNNMRLFIEQGKFDIRDKDTIEEFMHFILIDDKYQADDGYHDDMVMSLAITFAPFCETKNFDDIKGLVDALYSKSKAENESDFSAYMPIGFLDDNGDDSTTRDTTYDNSFGFGFGGFGGSGFF